MEQFSRPRWEIDETTGRLIWVNWQEKTMALDRLEDRAESFWNKLRKAVMAAPMTFVYGLIIGYLVSFLL